MNAHIYVPKFWEDGFVKGTFSTDAYYILCFDGI